MAAELLAVRSNDLLHKFQHHINRRNLNDRVRVIAGDLRDVILSDATIIVLYLLPEAIAEIRPKLQEAILRNARIICNTWGPKSWRPVQRLSCGFSNNVTLLLYDKSSIGEPLSNAIHL